MAISDRFDPFHFVQQVPKAGFRWVSVRVPDHVGLPPLLGVVRGSGWTGSSSGTVMINLTKGPYRIDRYLASSVPRRSSEFRAYNPLREGGLFRTFADLELTEEGILQFANRYGLLGTGESNLFRCEDDSWELGELRTATSRWETGAWQWATSPQIPDGSEYFGESFSTWQDARDDLRHALEIWDTEKTNPGRLRDLKPSQWKYGGLVSNGSSEPGGPRNIIELINKRLQELHVTPHLLPDSTFSKFNLRLVPRDLLGCLWWQFANALDGDRAYRQCQYCRHWFEVTPQVARKDRLFCNPTCKAGAHRKKISQARELSSKGKTAREIATILETKVQKVKGWIK